MAAAVIRVKRRIAEEPLSALVLYSKKKKPNEDLLDSLLNDKDETSTVLKFAGTVDNQDNIASQITKLSKEDACKLITRTRQPDLTGKNRDETRQSAQSNRFKVVNCFRALDEAAGAGTTENGSGTATADSAKATAKPITIVDIEKQSTSTDLSSETETSHDIPDSENYVYDLYLPEAGAASDIDDNLVNNFLSVRPFDDFLYERGTEDKSDSDNNASDDSNDENNSRNEYPEDEEHGDDDNSSIDDDDMRRAVQNMGIDSDRESSDNEEYENGFVYSIDSEAIGHEEDLDDCDVNRYGEAYARYKRRVLKERERQLNDSELDNCEVDESD